MSYQQCGLRSLHLPDLNFLPVKGEYYFLAGLFEVGQDVGEGPGCRKHTVPRTSALSSSQPSPQGDPMGSLKPSSAF